MVTYTALGPHARRSRASASPRWLLAAEIPARRDHRRRATHLFRLRARARDVVGVLRVEIARHVDSHERERRLKGGSAGRRLRFDVPPVSEGHERVILTRELSMYGADERAAAAGYAIRARIGADDDD